MRNTARQPHLRTVAIESWQYASILFTIFWETCSPPPHSPLATKRQSFCDSRFHCMAKPTMELSSFSICDIFHFHFLIDLSTYRHANGTAKKNRYNRNVIVNRIQMKLRQALRQTFSTFLQEQTQNQGNGYLELTQNIQRLAWIPGYFNH